jgi:MFS family permease
VAIALPRMARTFHVDWVDMNLSMTVYLITLAVLLPLSNWAAERWGPRPIFATAVGAFTLASLACAISATLSCFLIARVCQGAAAAMMTPVGRVVVLRYTEKSALMNAVALLTWPALVAPAIAPPLGGLIVEHLGWPWIFLINVPIGVVGMIVALRLLPDGQPGPKPGTDWYGFAVWALAVTLIVGGVESARRLTPLGNLMVLGGGGVVAIIAWSRFAASKVPLLDVRLIATYRSFGAAILEGSAFRSAILTNPFLLPLYFQVGLGKGMADTALLIMVGMAGNIGMKPFNSLILRRFGFRRVLWVNGIALGMGFGAFMATGRDTSFEVLVALLLLSGLSRSLQFTTLNTVAFADIDREDVPAASTLLATAQQLNGAMGVAIGALAIQIGAHVHGAGSVGAFHTAFGAIAVMSLIAALSCLRHDRTLGSRLLVAT